MIYNHLLIFNDYLNIFNRVYYNLLSSKVNAQQSGHRTLLYGHAVLLRHLQSNMVYYFLTDLRIK